MSTAEERGRRVYNRWAGHPKLFRALDQLVCLGRRHELDRRATAALGLEGGERVLDLACGLGGNLRAWWTRSGHPDRFSPSTPPSRWVIAARQRVLREGWQNIEVLHSDAASADFEPASLDAALCTFGLSVIADRRVVIDPAEMRSDRGCRFVVLDGRAFRGPGRVLNPLLKPLLRYTSDWQGSDADPVVDLREALDEVAVEEFNLGTLFIAVARKRPSCGPRPPARR